MANSHKRETARRTPPAAILAGSLATLATGAVVSLGVFGSSAPTGDLVATDSSQAAGSVADAAGRLPAISRGGGRKLSTPAVVPLSKADRLLAPAAVATAVKTAKKKQWTTDDLNLWTRPDDAAKQVGELESGKQVLVTGRTYGERVEIVLAGKARWITAGYLSDDEPPKLGGACTNGTTVPASVSEHIVAVHAAVCANFPSISTYGTLRGGGGDHPLGKAVDIMVSGSTGQQVADFVRANASALGVSYVIYAQKIWSVERSGEGWRPMPSRGSITANHYDHVHVSVF